MRRWTTGVIALLAVLSFASTVLAQGGGASSTGTIQGRVTDAQGAVLPGVTVTATSPTGNAARRRRIINHTPITPSTRLS